MAATSTEGSSSSMARFPGKTATVTDGERIIQQQQPQRHVGCDSSLSMTDYTTPLLIFIFIRNAKATAALGSAASDLSTVVATPEHRRREGSGWEGTT